MDLTYDASEPPDAAAWLAASEWERMDATRAFCEQHEPDLPNVELHAAIHAVVEAQILMGEEIPVAATQRRLLAEGLSRHDTIHAIGAVLSGHLYHLMKGSGPKSDSNPVYYQALEGLTAASWRAMVEEPPRPRSKKPRRRPKRRRK